MLTILQYLYNLLTNTFRRKNSDKIYLSFGENCLTDNILKRYNLKSFTTPFSHSRSNIEYILKLEEENYDSFLKKDFLVYEDLKEKPVPRLKTHLNIINQYHSLHMNGFEFTHHDVINSQNDQQKILRRVHRLKSVLGKKKYVILYHHRVCEDNNLSLLISHLSELKKYYDSDEFKCEVILFKQIIIDKGSKKKLNYRKEDDVHVFDFLTYNDWTGGNPKFFFGIIDESLIRKMMKKITTL